MQSREQAGYQSRRASTDVKAHVVRYRGRSMLLWVDHVGKQMRGIEPSQDAIEGMLGALARWSSYLEPSWRASAN